MAPKRARVASSSQVSRFTIPACADHYHIIKDKGIVHERSINFPAISFLPVMAETAEAYRWMEFNSMIGESNASRVEEFYANVLGRADNDYTSTVRGVEISYAPDVIDQVFGF
ncbi:hypothetical protein A2U01_0010340, partial [Trifolium medium]|nr:hypothetical protein [Trifolium medium]